MSHERQSLLHIYHKRSIIGNFQRKLIRIFGSILTFIFISHEFKYSLTGGSVFKSILKGFELN
jgi:hypothetical protein